MVLLRILNLMYEKRSLDANVLQISEGKALKNENLILKINIIMKTKMSNYRNCFALAYVLLAVVLLTSCTTSAEKEGEIIKDSRGNYYRLTNDKVFGNERYRLIEIDTTSFKRF